jgi:pyridoxamine 5'-phosphate oxidase
MASARVEWVLRQLRELPVFENETPPFDPSRAPGHPAELFLEWLVEAIDAGVREPHAMTLSTVDGDGRPSSRVLILKAVDDGRWRFATSRTSRKGRELAVNPWAAANFHWREQGRQVRLRGRVMDAGPEQSAKDYLARPESSRIASAVGRQSETLEDPADLDDALEEAGAEVAADPTAVPDHWAVYDLIPDEMEFWQADRDRRHVRLAYRLVAGSWESELLWP